MMKKVSLPKIHTRVDGVMMMDTIINPTKYPAPTNID